MKITEVKAVYPKYERIPDSWRTNFWQIVVRIESDKGVVGFGYGGGGVASEAIVNLHFRELLIGQQIDSVSDIHRIWDSLYEASLPYGRKGLAIMAISGVDLALYDLLGKALKLPVSQLLGGKKKNQVDCYATGSDPERFFDLGFNACKLPHRWSGDESSYEDAEEKISNARRIFGKDAKLMLDVYMSWDFDVTIEMSRRLSKYNVFWFEDVLTPDDLSEQSRLKSYIDPILIAGGEHEFTHHGFQAIADADALGLWQPDITWCGGITAGERIVEIANQFGIPVSPHRGAEVWALHLIEASDCLDLAEYHQDHIVRERDEVWINEPIPMNGKISSSSEPGFGVEVNQNLL